MEGNVDDETAEMDEVEEVEEDGDVEDESPEAAAYLEGFVPVMVLDERSEQQVGRHEGQRIGRSGRDKRSADQFFAWMISPVTLDRFYGEIWEKKPLLIQRKHNRLFWDGWLGKADVEQFLSSSELQYGSDVDVTKYSEGGRETLNGEGTVDSAEAWRQFHQSGCSIRMLHPQRWSDPIWLMLSTLERHWSAIAGCNVYLTPPNSQGFAPHFDDIDAFILQVEGSKRWRCYPPISEVQILPRFSSPDFGQEEIGEPILDVVIHAGDLLYMPRGTIHQAEALSDCHSLHLTVSMGQRNTWADFLELALPRALQLASEECLQLRQSLPRDMFEIMGVSNEDASDERRCKERQEKFILPLQACVQKVFEGGPWDAAVDQLAAGFLTARLPPFSEEGAEKKVEAHGDGAKKDDARKLKKLKKGETLAFAKEGNGLAGPTLQQNVQQGIKILPKTKVRVRVYGSCRLVVEDDCAVVYHMMQNERCTHNVGDGDDDHGDDDDDDDDDDGGHCCGAHGSEEERGEGKGGLEKETGKGKQKEAKEEEEGEGEHGAKSVHVHEGGCCEGKRRPMVGREVFPLECAQGLECLLKTNDAPVTVKNLGFPSLSSGKEVVSRLVEVGVLEVVC